MVASRGRCATEHIPHIPPTARRGSDKRVRRLSGGAGSSIGLVIGSITGRGAGQGVPLTALAVGSSWLPAIVAYSRHASNAG